MIALRPSAGLLLRVSWLLAACIPGLLMLSTFGLERLETGLHRGPGAAQEAATFLEQAVRAAREEAQLRAAETAPKRPDTHFGLLTEEPGLPTGCTRTRTPIRSFTGLDTPIVCSVGSLRNGLPQD